MKTNILEIDKGVTEEDLADRGLSVENIVCTLELGQEFDLTSLVEYLDNSEYEPETSPFLVYRPDEEVGTAIIPTNGLISLVGCKRKEQIIKLADHIIKKLAKIRSGDFPSSDEVVVQNIVVRGSVDTELELSPIVVLLGMEQAEYEPEQFPGIIYRPNTGRTVLIFSSGIFMVNGATSYFQAVSTVDDLIERFREGGVPIDDADVVNG